MPNNKIPDGGFLDELPPGASRRSENAVLRAFADELRANAGKWKAYPRPAPNPPAASKTAYNIRRGLLTSFPKGEFEAAMRDGVTYVRAVPK